MSTSPAAVSKQALLRIRKNQALRIRKNYDPDEGSLVYFCSGHVKSDGGCELCGSTEQWRHLLVEHGDRLGVCRSCAEPYVLLGALETLTGT